MIFTKRTASLIQCANLTRWNESYEHVNTAKHTLNYDTSYIICISHHVGAEDQKSRIIQRHETFQETQKISIRKRNAVLTMIEKSYENPSRMFPKKLVSLR